MRRHPRDARASRHRQRLAVRRLNPADALEEAEMLVSLGEPVPVELLGRWLEALVRRGRIAEAKAVIEVQTRDLSPKALVGLGWEVRRVEAHDLAVPLFLRGFSAGYRSAKFLNALERSASLTGQGEAVMAVYKAWADRSPNLYGRRKRLGLPQ